MTAVLNLSRPAPYKGPEITRRFIIRTSVEICSEQPEMISKNTVWGRGRKRPLLCKGKCPGDMIPETLGAYCDSPLMSVP
jgi:hypothetical protein